MAEPIRVGPSGEFLIGDEGAADATPGQVILVWNPDATPPGWESRKLPNSGGETPALNVVLGVGNNAADQPIHALGAPTVSGDAAQVGFRGFVNDYSAEIEAGDFDDQFFPVAGHIPGDVVSCYMTLTSASAWPFIELSVRTSNFNVVGLRIRNTGPDVAVIESGSLTFYISYARALTPE
jgi:hypothetical protein